MSFQKKNAIRDLKAASAAQDIDDNFDAIWNALRLLRNLLEEDSDEVNGVVGRDGALGPPGENGADGDPGPPGPPGAAGPAGANGATGAAGPTTIGPMMMEGENSDEMWPIPGPQGPQGNTGASASWTLVSTTTAAGAANYDITGLGSYTEIMIITNGITKSVSGTTNVRVSTDGGGTYLSASGDYIDVSVAGAEVNTTAMLLHTTSATLARDGQIVIRPNNSSTLKWALSTSGDEYIIPTTSAINAVRILGSGGGNLNAGTIYVYGR